MLWQAKAPLLPNIVPQGQGPQIYKKKVRQETYRNIKQETLERSELLTVSTSDIPREDILFVSSVFLDIFSCLSAGTGMLVPALPYHRENS